MIDKYSPIPMYYQLEELIKNSIEEGKLKPGDTLPSEREYTEKYEISKMTVRQATTNLVHNGYLVRERGKGTFVANQKIEQTLKGLTSFSEDMRSKGMEPGTKILDFKIVSTDQDIAKKLNIEEGSPIYKIERVRLADGFPMAYETSFLSIVSGLTEEIIKGSLYDHVEKTLGLTIDYATQVMEASTARARESDILGIHEGAPILVISRITYLKNEKPLEVVNSIYRGDRYKFVIDIKRDS